MQRWLLPVTTVSLIIGLLVSVQYKSQSQSRALAPSSRVENLAFMLKSTEQANHQLSDQVSELQARLNKLQSDEPRLDENPGAAYPPVAGPGLVVTITESGAESKMDDGTSAVVHAEDLLKIINELRSGGAEAVALNGHRLTEISEVETAGQHVVVNKKAIAPPYVIAAIGPAEEMKNTLALRGGVVEYLQFYGIEVKSAPKLRLQLEGAPWLPAFKFAKPAREPQVEALGALGDPS